MGVLPEDDLRSLSKQFGTIVPKTEPVSDQELLRLDNLLQELFESAEAPQLTATHRAAAGNALCGFLDVTTSSTIQQVKSVSLKQTVWDRIISLYLDRFSESSARSMKQVLNTLINLLTANSRDMDVNGMVSGWTQGVLNLCLNFIYCSKDFSSVKPSMMLLEVLVSTTSVTYDKMIDALLKIESTDRRSISQALVTKILKWSRNPDVSLASGRLLKTLFSERNNPQATESMASDEQEPVWLQPLLDITKDKTTDLEKLEKYILAEILSVNEQSLLLLVQRLRVHRLLHKSNDKISESDIRFILSLLNVMHQMKLSSKLKLSLQLELRTPFEQVRDTLAINCLRHQSPHIRIAAARLIVISDGTASVFTDKQLQALQPAIRAFFTESDAKIRGDVTHLIKKLTARLLLVINKLKKNANNGQASDAAMEYRPEVNQSPLYRHLEFVTWFQEFLLTEIRPSASYQRHVVALKSLNMDSTLELFSACQIDAFTIPVVRQIAEMVMDAFDDVRSLAASLLKKQQTIDAIIVDSSREDSVISIAKTRMIGTGRASISDGYARLVELSYHFGQLHQLNATILYCTPQSILSDISNSLFQARSSLALAVSNSQLHGQFSSLRYVINHPNVSSSFSNQIAWRTFQNCLIDSCRQAWDVVKPVLCIDSPEGHGDEDVHDLDIGVKDTLSFSWRTLKEASSLMQAVLTSPYYGDLQHVDFENIGSLAFVQLSELRHRGAFSTVAQCFATCCIACGRSKDVNTRRLPGKWYAEAMQSIEQQAAAVTRRSAGLPALITGVLVSDPVGAFFDNVMMDLQRLANQPVGVEHKHGKTGLPQVHAMNCLKDIFASTRLGPSAERYLEACLQISVQSLKHNVYSIRNCGGMLLKAILNRMNNGSNSEIQPDEDEPDHGLRSKAIYNRFPGLAYAVETLLEASLLSQEADTENVDEHANTGFPAFEIIDRVGVKENPRIVTILRKLLESPVWSLRERAASVLGKLVKGDHLIETLYRSIDLDSQANQLQSNSLHGRLVCIKYAVELSSKEIQKSMLRRLVSHANKIMTRPSRYTICALLEVLSAIFIELCQEDYAEDDDDLLTSVYDFPPKALLDHISGVSELHRFRFLKASWLFSQDQSGAYRDEFWLGEPAISAGLTLMMEFPKLLRFWMSDIEVWATDLVYEFQSNRQRKDFFDRVQKMIKTLSCDRVSTYVSKGMWYYQLPPPDFDIDLDCPSRENTSTAVVQFLLILKSFWHIRIHCDSWLERMCLAINREQDSEIRLSYMKMAYTLRSEIVAQLFQGPVSDWVGLYQFFEFLCDGLNDDDNEIRETTADVVSHVFSNYASNILPSITSITAQELVFEHFNHFNQDKSKDSEFSLWILSRILGVPYSNNKSATDKALSRLTLQKWLSKTSSRTLYYFVSKQAGPIAKMVQDVLYEDNTLFEAERQNLFKDNVQEMEQWADLLISMRSPMQEVQDIYDWAIYGLEMVERSDGSPGWMYRREGFEAVCKVLVFAKIVQAWSKDVDYQKKLNDAVLRVESKLAIANPEHTRLIEDLKAGFSKMNLDALDALDD